MEVAGGATQHMAFHAPHCARRHYEALQLYAAFMVKLSGCIFALNPADLALLIHAKRAELSQQRITGLSNDMVRRSISKKEILLHCRRSTRGDEETTHLIGELIEAFDSEQGRDTMEVPLLDHERMWEIWATQQQHVKCLQDPDATVAQLYMQTGTLRKGGVELPVYRCARGSTSLESFHLHLNRFIAGKNAQERKAIPKHSFINTSCFVML